LRRVLEIVGLLIAGAVIMFVGLTLKVEVKVKRRKNDVVWYGDYYS
jgi:hypothetical protein